MVLFNLDGYSTRACHPRLHLGTEKKATFVAAARAQQALTRLVDEVLTETSRSDAQLGDGTLTPVGAAKIRQQIAARFVARLDSEVGANVRQAEADAKDAEAALHETFDKTFGTLSSAVIEGAKATAAYVVGSTDAAVRAELLQGIRAGERDAVLAGLFLPSVGIFAAHVRAARDRFADSELPPEKRGDVRRAQIAARVVRMQYDGARASLASMATSGEAPRLPDASALLARANDAALNELIDEGELLAVLVPRTTGTGRQTTPTAAAAAAGGARSMFDVANNVGKVGA